MSSRLGRYATLVFDCDGVLLNSNAIKTEAFRSVAGAYGSAAAEALVHYHTHHGGISRYAKFEYLLGTVLGRPVVAEEVASLAAAYGARVYQLLVECEVAPELQPLRDATAAQGWMIVSGGDEQELRRVFAARGLGEWFDRGIFGSPSTKDEILAREIARGNLALPALFVGDSRYDHEAAARAGLDFVFLSKWSEFHGWSEYCAERGIEALSSLDQLLG